jgi:dihydroorotate dehydrogenase
MKTHWKKTMNPNYLGAYALEPNEDLVVEITEVKTESVMNADGRNEECLVAHLKDHKPLIVNKTNAKAIAKVCGSNYIEDWKGKQIALYISNVKAFGELVEAIRVRTVAPKAKSKRKLNDDDFKKLVKAVADGSYLLEDAVANFVLNDSQRSILLQA